MRSRSLLIILLATVAVYALSLGNGFVNLDDPLLITENRHVLEPSFANVWYVFTHFDPELYIPVTFLTYQLEGWTLGFAAWHFHLVSILLHLGCVVLVWSIVRRISKDLSIAAGTAALFALHPINSEAVLWISARKDLLSAFFFLASVEFFLRYQGTKNRRSFIGSLSFAILAMGSKVTAVTLPIVLLLSRPRRAALIPYFAASLLFGIIAIIGKTVVGSMLEPGAFLAMIFRSTFFYLSLIVAPAGQAAVHSMTRIEALQPTMILLSIVVVLGIASLAWRLRKRLPLFSLGIAFFFLTLAPTWLHYTRGTNAFILGSERYMYLPSAGIFLAIATLWSALYHSPRLSLPTKRTFIAGSVACVLVLAYLTVLRTFVFNDAVIFNIDILQKHPEDARAHHNLAVALEEARRPMEAEEVYRKAMQLEPTFLETPIALGSLFMREGRYDEAKELFERAITIRPDSWKGYYNLGLSQELQGQYEDSLANYRLTEERFPDFPELHLRLATVLGKLQRFEEALLEYQKLAALDPGFRERYEAAQAQLKGN